MGTHNIQAELERGKNFTTSYRGMESPEGFTRGFGTTVGGGVEGWAPGALYQDTDAAAGSQLYVNTGSKTSATWTQIADAGVAAGFTVSSTGITLNDDVPIKVGTSGDTEILFSDADASNHTTVIALDNTSQQLHITDVGAKASDWARSAGTHPEVSIHSNTTPITDYLAIGNHDGTTATIDVVGGTTLNLDCAGTTAAAVSTSGLAVTGVSSVSGVTTPTGGQAPAGGTTIVLARPGCVHTGGIPATATAEGVDATPVITEIYYSELFVPCNMSVTGISFFNGSVATNDSRHSALLDADGALVTGSATGAVATAGVDVYQKVPFTGGAITVLGPATYYVATIFGGTTDRYNAHGTATTGLGFPTNMVAGKITGQTYGAIPATNTLTLTYTTDVGPIASLY